MSVLVLASASPARLATLRERMSRQAPQGDPLVPGCVARIRLTAASWQRSASSSTSGWSESRVPIHTVSWPTWERTGNIVHYLGAARYVASNNVTGTRSAAIRSVNTIPALVNR